MNIEDHLLLWNHASIKVLDVRYRILSIGKHCTHINYQQVFFS